TLAVTAPAGAAALGTAVAFSTNASGDFTYQWTFGDGATSTEAAPSHLFARPGIYVVTVILRNGDGQTATATVSVAVADRGIVQGKVCSGPAESGWCWQQPLPQGNAIRAFHWVDDAVAYAVGQRGQILKSTDGGATWRGQFSGTTVDLGPLAFVNAQVGWVAGANGEVLRTADGGANWERLSTGRADPVMAIGAVDADRAWIVTLYGSVLVTRDGGRQWKPLVPPESSVRIVALSDLEFWLLPYSAGNSPSVLHTVDGGASWVRVPLPQTAPGLYTDPIDLQFASPVHGLYVRTEYGYDGGGAYVSRRQQFVTADGGATWQPLPPAPGADGSSRYLLAAPGTVYWIHPYTLPARSTDSGATWQSITLPSGLGFSYDPQLQTFGANRLLVSDFYGATWLSVDGGMTWNASSAGGPGSFTAFNSVWFFDSREGVAWADNGSSARTTDGGQTWTLTSPAVGLGWRRGQFLADGSLGWIVSDDGVIYRSSDKGRTWFAPAPQTTPAMYGLQDLHFLDAQHGWAVSPYGSAGGSAIWRSSDGGLSWQLPDGVQVPGGFLSVRFADATHGVAVGPAGVALVTSDGGLTWRARPTGAYSLWRVTFADADTAVAVGDQGTIARSSDRGETWSVVQGPTFNTLLDVRFVSATLGHAVGDQGLVLVTRDGGLTWSREESGSTVGLRAVFFIDEMSGWAAGYSGSILATATGGR
ncbi:MAG: YCF48-related protein, partial [Jiangellaceae bacterium]